ncbi:sensor histidine kinase [Sphingomonas sp. SFZ2018-12]|uniref:sensor histidine kinase n=1 Tax=Sphingomonas sp. SFZ2018-12 TaxID=2683197 RepID=UPI001F0F2883|nr:sensor histidine kinase [Sphingomonas sp. SFZ2018-12]
MRFDDTFATVLATDLSHSLARETAWRQLVDLIARGRAPLDDGTLGLLHDLHREMPESVRAAGGRMLQLARPPAPLVRLFAADVATVSTPVLRAVTLDAADWLDLLPHLSPVGRAVLRHRTDLPAAVGRALEAFGATDFVLSDDRDGIDDPGAEAVAAAPAPPPATLSSFATIGSIARGLPFVAQAPAAEASAREQAEAAPGTGEARAAGPFRIADIVARIDAYHQRRARARDAGEPVVADPAPATPAAAAAPPPGTFRFEADANGVIRWADGIERAMLIGLSLHHPAPANGTGVDGVAAGAVQRRAGFDDARLQIAGRTADAGDWLISGVPVFERQSGRFTGYRGTARRPRADERADHARRSGDSRRMETLRELVHELRTPIGAISGFAEMIAGEILGPVPPIYRERAQTIRANARELLAIIDDIDLAARMDAHALDLRPGRVAMQPVLAGIVRDLSQLIALRAAEIVMPETDAAVRGDRRAVERLLARLIATVVAVTEAGERIAIRLVRDGDREVVVAIDCPRELRLSTGEARATIDLEDEGLVSTGFSMRLVTNLARELGGALAIDADRLTLRLPAADDPDMEKVIRS